MNRFLGSTMTFLRGSNFYCSASVNELLLLASLFLGESSILVLAMALYMKGERRFSVFVSSKPGAAFLVAVAVLVLACAVIARQYVMSKRSQSNPFRKIVMMNLVTVILLLLTVEITIRISARSSKEGARILNTVLLPKQWEKVAQHYRQQIDQASDLLSFLIYDDYMGWTVAPNKRSADGLYWSSSEGIRAPHDGVAFANQQGRTRIALVGDSFTFGQEVPYEDTWGNLLEQALGSEFQVLNFGVPGYGVDQAYLRYEKDVRRWNPKIIIFGFIAHDLIRTLSVYHFLAFPESSLPFSTPRFVLADGALQKRNIPPLAPDDIFSRESIAELPFLEYQPEYNHTHWEKSLSYLPYVARLFISRFPRWSMENAHGSHEAFVSLNASILKAFVQTVKETESIPLVVYFPSGREVTVPGQRFPAAVSQQVLEEASIAYTDLSPCLMELNPADRLVPNGVHYSRQGNAKVADCLYDVVKKAIDGQMIKNPTILTSHRP
jgi:hypothetical protein